MKENKAGENRRDFLKLAATAAPVAAVAVVASPKAAMANESAKGEGLRKTPHVEAYLKSARF